MSVLASIRAARRGDSVMPVAVAVVLLHVLGWGTLLLAAASGADAGGTTVLVLGLTAYAFGLRHAFDADHIAAIDNTTRTLQARGLPAKTVGFWFSLGHSTVVFALCGLLAAGMGLVSTALADDGSLLHEITGVWGPTVSSVFLVVLAAFGFASLLSHRDESHGGPVWHALSKTQRVIDRPSRMYVVGLLFGLGFDTATEIGLLALAGGSAASGMPWWVALSLPTVFAAGMSMLDTAQGALAQRAYAYAPQAGRRPGYARWMTAVSAVAALVVAVIQLSGLAADHFDVAGPVAWLASLDLEDFGIGLTAVLLGTWACVAVVTIVRRRRGGDQAA